MRRLSLVLCAALVLAPAVALADPQPVDVPRATPLLAGQAAPHSGILLTPQSATDCALKGAQLEQAQAQVKARDAALAQVLPQLERSPIERYGFVIGLVAGVVVGAGVTVAVVAARK